MRNGCRGIARRMGRPVRFATQQTVSDEHDLAKLLRLMDIRADQRQDLRRHEVSSAKHPVRAKLRDLRWTSTVRRQFNLRSALSDRCEVRRLGSRGESEGGRRVALGAMRRFETR